VSDLFYPSLVNEMNSCTEAVHNIVHPLGRLTEEVLTLLGRFMVNVDNQVKSESLLLRSHSVGSFPVTCL
jgi:hypothetical protein